MLEPCIKELKPADGGAATVVTACWNHAHRELHMVTLSAANVTIMYHRSYEPALGNATIVHTGATTGNAVVRQCYNHIHTGAATGNAVVGECYNHIPQKLQPRAPELQPFW